MMIFGSANVLLKEALVVDGFYMPFLWNMVTMVGQSFLLPMHWCKQARQPDDLPKGPQAPTRVLVMVTCIDLLALSLINTTYNILPGSIIQMLRGCKVMFTCFLSKLILGKTQQWYQLLGVGMNFIGLLLTGLAGDRSEWDGGALSHPQAVVAAFAVGITSQLVGSFQFIYEAKTMKQYDVPALQLGGMEGIIGAPIGLLVLLTVNVMGREDTPSAIAQMGQSSSKAGLMLGFLVAVATFNLSGITVTKYGSPVLRAMLEIARTALIWAVEVTLGWNQFSTNQLGGYVITSIGTLIYSHVIVIPFLEPAKPDNGKLSAGLIPKA